MNHERRRNQLEVQYKVHITGPGLFVQHRRSVLVAGHSVIDVRVGYHDDVVAPEQHVDLAGREGAAPPELLVVVVLDIALAADDDELVGVRVLQEALLDEPHQQTGDVARPDTKEQGFVAK